MLELLGQTVNKKNSKKYVQKYIGQNTHFLWISKKTQSKSEYIVYLECSSSHLRLSVVLVSNCKVPPTHFYWRLKATLWQSRRNIRPPIETKCQLFEWQKRYDTHTWTNNMYFMRCHTEYFSLRSWETDIFFCTYMYIWCATGWNCMCYAIGHQMVTCSSYIWMTWTFGQWLQYNYNIFILLVEYFAILVRMYILVCWCNR